MDLYTQKQVSGLPSEVMVFVLVDVINGLFGCNLAGKPTGYDRVRNAEIGNKDFELDVLEEAYTTEHWLVRIYKVKNLQNRGL